MMKIKYFNSLINLPLLTLATSLTLSSCSIAQEKSISIEADIKDISVTQDEQYTSSSINVTSIGIDKDIFDNQLKLSILCIDNSSPPNWIHLNENRQIVIEKDKPIGMFEFYITAEIESIHIYAQPKIFKLNVTQQKLIEPDSIGINIAVKQDFLTTGSWEIPFSITPYKDGYLPSQLDCFCDVSLQTLKGKDKDLNNNPLFNILIINNQYKVCISQYTDKTYANEYEVIIRAKLVNNPSIATSCLITINLLDGLEYSDSENKQVFTRSSINDDWSLSIVDSDKGLILEEELSTSQIYGQKVSKIGSNLCKNSNISKMVAIFFPTHITSIENCAFEDQNYLCIAHIPGVENVAEKAFYNNENLMIENGENNMYSPVFKKVGKYAFFGCKKLKLVKKQEIEVISDFSFGNSGLETIEIGENCKQICENAFNGCSNLKSITIWSKNPPQLGGSSFQGCNHLEKIYVDAKCVELYKSDPQWSAYQNKIEGIS